MVSIVDDIWERYYEYYWLSWRLSSYEMANREEVERTLRPLLAKKQYWQMLREELSLPKRIPISIAPYIDYLTRILEPLEGILYNFEIMIFTGFVYEEAAQIYARLALKYLCPLVITRLVVELFPRLVTVAAQIRYSVTAPHAVQFPGARALQKYADAVMMLVWVIEEIAKREGVPTYDLWYQGNIVEKFKIAKQKMSKIYADMIMDTISWYKEKFGEEPHW